MVLYNLLSVHELGPSSPLVYLEFFYNKEVLNIGLDGLICYFLMLLILLRSIGLSSVQ